MIGKIIKWLITLIIIVGVIFFLGYNFDNSFTCGLVNQYAPWVSGYIGCGIMPFSLGGSLNINGTTLQLQYTNQYRLNWSVANIISTQPGIKTWRSFANYTTNQEAQLNAFNNFELGPTSAGDVFVYNKSQNVYVPYAFRIIGLYYKNNTFSNYIPSLLNSIVSVQFGSAVGTTIGDKPLPIYYYKFSYKITNVSLKNGRVYYTLQEAFDETPVLTDIQNLNMTEMYNIASQPLGIYLQNGTEIVLPDK